MLVTAILFCSRITLLFFWLKFWDLSSDITMYGDASSIQVHVRVMEEQAVRCCEVLVRNEVLELHTKSFNFLLYATFSDQ